jgi:large subunit ribosomal protein L21
LRAAYFSEFFRELDKKSVQTMNHEFYVNKEYKRLMDQWQKPLLRKQIKREKRLLNPVVPNEEQDEVLYVHQPEEGIVLPPNPENIFAVFRVKGLQYKVAKDDRVMCELLPYEVGTQLELEDVLMVGTPDYTCIGRPTVNKARVFATVEETSQTEKVLIFKKRRRKDSQRNQGHRQWVTVLRVDKIVHEIDETQINSQQVELEALSLKPTVSII